MRFRFFLRASSTLFSFSLKRLRSIVCPVFFGPVNLVYCVAIFSPSAGGVSAAGAAASTLGASAALGFSTSGFSATGFSAFGSSTFASTAGAGAASSGVGVSSALGFSAWGFSFSALGAKSILPTAFGFWSSARALMTSCLAFSRSNFSCSRRSCSRRRLSFSFRFSSLISADASRLDLSVSNSSRSTL